MLQYNAKKGFKIKIFKKAVKMEAVQPKGS